MRSIKLNSFDADIYGVLLYRDDIEAILNLYIDKSLKTAILDYANEYDSIDELKKYAGSKVSKLFIEGEKQSNYGKISVSVNNMHCNICTFDEELLGMAALISNLIRDKVRWQHKFLNPVIWLPLTILGGITIFNPFISHDINLSHFVIYSTWFCVLMNIICGIDRKFNYGIRLTRKHETGFIKANKDQLLLLIIGSVLGAVLTLIVQWILK